MDIISPPLSINQIPSEIRGLIFNKLGQNLTPNLRVVCSQWDSDVENYFNFKTQKLDETSPNFLRICQLRIRSLRIEILRETSISDPDGGSPIFKYPNLITDLEIGASVSQANLHSVLRLCAQNLKKLRVEVPASFYAHSFQPDRPYHFPNLRGLEISIQDYFCHLGIKVHPHSFLRQLEKSEMPKLTSLKVQVTLSTFAPEADFGELVIPIMNLVVKKGRNLQSLCLDLETDSWKKELHGLGIIEMKGLEGIHKLKEVCIKMKPWGDLTSEFWAEFHQNQKELVKMRIEEDSPMSPVSIPFCRHVVLKNSDTLMSVYIHSLTIRRGDEPFDLSVFRNCHRLETLELFKDLNEGRGFLDTPDIVHLKCLPGNVRILTLDRFRILSSELLASFGGMEIRFKKLETLRLFDSGKSGAFGVNGSIFERLVNMEGSALRSLSIPSGFNLEDSEERKTLEIVVEELEKKSERFNESCYFLLTRDSIAHPWSTY